MNNGPLAGGIFPAHMDSGDRRMRYLHTMVRVADLDAALDFYVGKLGLKETRRSEHEKGRFTLVYLAAPQDEGRARSEKSPEMELN